MAAIDGAVDLGMLRQLGLDRPRLPDEQDAEIEVTRGRQRAVDNVPRRFVASHRVDRDPDHQDSVFVDGSGLAPFVVPAVGADAVRRLRLVAVRALAEARGFEGVVRAPLCRPCF